MSKLREISAVFFKLGCIAFGGPAAHIAMMEDEIISKRKWMSHQHFLDLIGVTNLIPGPNSTEMTMHCGYERGGWKGLFLAGGLFILPAVLITSLVAWLYMEYGQLPSVEPYIYGIKPAVIGVILAALWKLGKKAVKNYELAALGVLTTIACLLGVNEILGLFGCGVLGIIVYLIRSKSIQKTSNVFLFPLFFQIANEENLKILWTFLKVGSLLYGGGYVLFAFLDAELVSTGLLTRQQLMDAVAVGQITPGPVLSTATFIGWQLGGPWGAVMATIGIFLPSFLFVWFVNPLVTKIRKSPLLSAFLDAVNVAAVAVILVVLINMGKDTLVDWKTALIAFLSIAALFYYKKLNSAYVVLGGAFLGYILYSI